jgi:uncharacterized membrane protein YfcA
VSFINKSESIGFEMTDAIAVLLNLFSVGLPSFVAVSDPSYIFADPIFMAILVVLGFVVGTAIGVSGIGGAALIVPSLIFLGVPPQTMVGASLLFNFFTKIVGTALHSKERNISWSAFIYVMITVIPSMFLASWLWVYIETNYGSKTLDLFILLSIGILLVSIAGFIMKTHVLKRKATNLSSESQTAELRTNFSKTDKGALLGIGGLVSFMMQISSVGAGTILVPVLLKVVRSPKHVAGTSVIFGLVASFIGALLHYTLGDVPIYLVAFLLIGSMPGVLLGVRIASTISPRKLTFIFAIIILAAGLLILNEGIANVSS